MDYLTQLNHISNHLDFQMIVIRLLDDMYLKKGVPKGGILINPLASFHQQDGHIKLWYNISSSTKDYATYVLEDLKSTGHHFFERMSGGSGDKYKNSNASSHVIGVYSPQDLFSKPLELLLIEQKLKDSKNIKEWLDILKSSIPNYISYYRGWNELLNQYQKQFIESAQHNFERIFTDDKLKVSSSGILYFDLHGFKDKFQRDVDVGMPLWNFMDICPEFKTSHSTHVCSIELTGSLQTALSIELNNAYNIMKQNNNFSLFDLKNIMLESTKPNYEFTFN